MVRCNGTTKSGSRCKKYSSVGDFCNLHKSKVKKPIIEETVINGDPPHLPSEMWEEIISYMGLIDMAKWHLCCKFSYYTIKNRFSEKKSYLSIIIDRNGNHCLGNMKSTDYGFIARADGSHCEYTVFSKIMPMNVDINKILLPPNPLINRITNYNHFIDVVSTMIILKHREDTLFLYTGNLTDDVINYSKTKKIEYLTRSILSKYIGKGNKTLTHYLTGAVVPKTKIHWGECVDVIKEVATKIRKIHPSFKIILSEGKIFITTEENPYY